MLLIGTAALASLLNSGLGGSVAAHVGRSCICVLLELLSLHDNVFLLKENT